MSKIFTPFVALLLIVAVALSAMLGMSSAPELLRSLTLPMAATMSAIVLTVYGALQPRPEPRWYDKTTFAILYVVAVLVLTALVGQVDYWSQRLGPWVLLAYLASGLILTSALMYHTLGNPLRRTARQG